MNYVLKLARSMRASKMYPHNCKKQWYTPKSKIIPKECPHMQPTSPGEFTPQPLSSKDIYPQQ